jgi:hypothetical protein
VPSALFLGHTDATARSREEWLKEVVEFMPKNWQRVQDILEEHAQQIHEQNEKLLAEGKLRVYEVGDKVYALNHESDSQKLQFKVKPSWLGPYTVKTKLSLTTYELRDETTNETFIVWCGHLKPARDQTATRVRQTGGRAGSVQGDAPAHQSSQEEKEEKEEKQEMPEEG